MHIWCIFLYSNFFLSWPLFLLSRFTIIMNNMDSLCATFWLKMKKFPQVVLLDESQISDSEEDSSAGKTPAARRNVQRCSQCGFISVDNRTHFLEHCRTHEGEKPFSCHECSYQTADPSHLKRHLRIHTGEKPFSCPHCPYRSSENAKVKRHMLTHKWSVSPSSSMPPATFMCLHVSVWCVWPLSGVTSLVWDIDH